LEILQVSQKITIGNSLSKKDICNDYCTHKWYEYRGSFKILGHNSIKVTLDSCGTIIDELMLSNVSVLKEKLSMKKEELTQNGKDKLSQPHDDLISQIKNGSKN